MEQVIAAYYSKDYGPLFARITEGCTFIGACREVFHGADELRAALPESEAPVMFLRDAAFEIASPEDESRAGAVVMGTHQVYTGPRETMLCSVKQRTTVCCALSPEGWKAYHIHTSNEWNELVGDEVFPVKTGRETYEYVRAILRTGRRAGMLPSRIEIATATAQRYVDPDDVVYVEASGKHCLIHCVGETISFKSLLSEVESQLPGSFLRVHRSYLVNTAHVTGMRRFTLDLSDGTQLPIPERKYDEVRREITLRVSD